ncbi:MAG: S-layer homology domain-containing protein [Evtepia gabavorous]
MSSILGEDGYPHLNEEKTGSGESLSYLFNGFDSRDTGEKKVEGKAAYMDVGGLLQRDQEGYYYYDCTKNFASFDENENQFTLYEKGGVKEGAEENARYQFFPFNTAEQVFNISGGELNDKELEGSESAPARKDIINHYFGVSMVTRFVQTKDGKSPFDSTKPVTYEFSGDDDVWIFIDGVLVADLGGIHDPASVKIDFSTGKIDVNGGDGSKQEGASSTTLKKVFESAGKQGNEGDWDENTFREGTFHTLNFFYLERGNGASNMSLKFNMKVILESEIKKVSQDYTAEGTAEGVAGAEFALYPADESWDIIDGYQNAPYATGTTDEKGEFILLDQENVPLVPSDLQGVSSYWVLRETEVPEGYRGIEEVHFHLQSNDSGYPILLSDSTWDVGAYAMSKVLATARTVSGEESGAKYVETTEEGKVKVLDSEGKPVGTMFSVILKRPNDFQGTWEELTLKDLTAVSGNPEKGWKIHPAGMEGVLEAAQENWYPFKLGTEFTCAIENLPGDIEKYYLVAATDQKKNAEYTGGYFYINKEITSADDLKEVNPNDIVMLDPSEFQRQFAMSLYVPNIQNRLLVQKTDEEGKPLDGATFALYKQSDVTITDGKYTITEQTGPVQTSEETGTITEGVSENIEGAATFSGIPKGEYYLIETEAPAGFEKNPTAVPVIVDNTGVYADAGDQNDMVSVNLGVGKLVKSMVQFAEDDDIDATLHDIKAALETGTYDNEAENPWTWTEADEETWNSTNPEEIMHLSYSSSNAVLEYGPIEGYSNALTYDKGWGRLSIRQCLTHTDTNETKSPKQPLEDQSLNNLFSGTTMVVVGNKRQEAGTLCITKDVKGIDDNIASQLSFDITLTAEPKNLNGGTVYRMKENETRGEEVEFKDGTATLSIHGGETITLQVPAGVTITVKEDAVSGFTVAYEDTSSASEAVSASEQSQGISVTIEEKADKAITITNTFDSGNAVAEIIPAINKTFTGSGWNIGDAVSFQIEAMTEDTPVPNPNRITITKSSDSTASASFAPIIFTEAGTYQYEITEDEGDLNRVKYDTSVYTLSVTVTDNEERGLTVSNWSIKKNGKPADEIVFTNHRSSGSHRPDPDPDDDKPSLNTEDHYGYIIGYPVDYYTGLPTEDQTKKPVKPQGNITRAEVATIYFRMLTDESRNHFWSQDSGYPDVALADWFNNAIATLSNGGIISGYPDGTFDPNGYITRAEFAVIAARFFDMDYQGEDLFPDIDGHWAQDYINQAAENGFIEGYPDGTFGPDKYITRAEAVTLVNRTLDRHPDPDHFLEDMLVWPDNLDTEQWYYADMQEATNSHEYQVKKDAQGNEYEVWTKVLPVRDWEAFEKEWSDANSAENPGEVVGKN